MCTNHEQEAHIWRSVPDTDWKARKRVYSFTQFSLLASTSLGLGGGCQLRLRTPSLYILFVKSVPSMTNSDRWGMIDLLMDPVSQSG